MSPMIAARHPLRHSLAIARTPVSAPSRSLASSLPRSSSNFLALSVALLLAACGGGGGDATGSASTDPQSAGDAAASTDARATALAASTDAGTAAVTWTAIANENQSFT